MAENLGCRYGSIPRTDVQGNEEGSMKIMPFVVALWSAGCGSSPRDNHGLPDAPVADASAPDAATPRYSADVVGSAVPAEATVFMVWIVVSGSPDYLYKFGDGASAGGHYTASLSGPLPAEAINADGIAVGFFGLVPKNTHFADGKVDSNALESVVIGASRNGLVFRTKDAQVTGWRAAFPAGEVSCGRCVAGPTPGSQETLEPAPCSEVAITTGAQACNVL
jgi:hypothetical protein